MNVNDFLALNEQMLAFETIMAGKLKKEMDMAKEALENLRKGRDLLAVEEFNLREQARLDAFRKEMDEQFSREQKTIDQTQSLQTEKEHALKLYEEELNNRERAMLRTEKSKQRDLDNAVENYHRDLSLLKEQQQVLVERQRELLVQEQQLSQKMNAIKAFA